MHQNSVHVILGVLLLSWTIIGTAAAIPKLRDAESQANPTTDKFFKGNLNCQCGVKKGPNTVFENPFIIGGTPTNIADIPSTFIIGGTPTDIANLPWTVHLYKIGFFGDRKPYCGGTIINNRYIVTAGHCVHGRSARRMEVVLNEQNTTFFGRTKSQTFKVSKIIMHPEYRNSYSNPDNDIALLQLAKAVELEGGSPIAPACIPTSNNDDFAGETALAAGWGSTKQGGGQSDSLLNVTVPVITNEQCLLSYPGQITENMLCAGDLENGGRDACQGDSGGPLITEVENRQLLIGVTSWGKGCGRPNYPGVYARLSRYPEWILSHTKDAEWCG